ncbi:hypothetical protein CK203_002980 [Vitis vinifera]|uniref:Protein kinase domain-containing protein n=1 Tax=Vitis vinifera TaxID=29760 RepID=A0A438KHL1_VITVI|nr:hypothetical protein CK203_002980 [Vitis vinifera]
MSMPSVLCRREGEGESRQSVIVALEGNKVSTAPLAKALRDLVGPTDELLVLAILTNIKTEALPILPSTDYSSNIKFLREEVSQRKEHYRNIFRPFYDRCKSSEVKFQLKVSAGCQPRDIIMEQAKNSKTTWIVIDRREAMILKYLALNDGSGTSAVDQVISNPEPSDLTEELPSQEEPQLCSSPNVGAEFQPFSPSAPESMSTERENPTMSEPYEECEIIEDLETPNISSQRLCDLMQVRPLHLSEEIVAAITGGFMTKVGTNRKENSETYTGFVADDQSQVMVKRFKGDSGGVLEAEKKAALYIYHKNILGLRGYHSSKNTTVLVFPFARGRTLDNYLYAKIMVGNMKSNISAGSRGKEVDLTFLDKMEIAIGIANATWLHLEQTLPFTNKRCPDKDPSDNPSTVLVKSDILSFGARPLLLERAFHELLGEDTQDLDMYGLYKVMTAATQCTKTTPSSRPCMSEVISILRGESSCAVQCSPTIDSSM